MKNKRKQSHDPTLIELLDPYLRNPPSPPPSSQSQLPAPQLSPLASSCIVQRAPAKPERRFHSSLTRFYSVHPRDFRALVQRLTGASATSSSSKPSMLEERQVKNNQNGPRSEGEPMSRDMGTNYSDRYAPPLFSPRTMDWMVDFCSEKIDGESSEKGSSPS